MRHSGLGHIPLFCGVAAPYPKFTERRKLLSKIKLTLNPSRRNATGTAVANLLACVSSRKSNPFLHRKEQTMRTRKNRILNLLIVGALVSIGSSATETFAATIGINVRARLNDTTLAIPIRLAGAGTVNITTTGIIAPGTFNLADTASVPYPGGAQISWSTGTVAPSGRFRVLGQAVAWWTDASMVTQYRHFKVVIRGRTNSTDRIRASFQEVSGSPGATLRGRCRAS